MPIERRFANKLEAYAQDAAACEAIRGRMVRANELEERLAREIGRAPALVAERALKRNCGATQVNAA